METNDLRQLLAEFLESWRLGLGAVVEVHLSLRLRMSKQNYLWFRLYRYSDTSWIEI